MKSDDRRAIVIINSIALMVLFLSLTGTYFALTSHRFMRVIYLYQQEIAQHPSSINFLHY